MKEDFQELIDIEELWIIVGYWIGLRFNKIVRMKFVSEHLYYAKILV